MPEHFIFDVTFSSSGDFNGTLTANTPGDKAFPAYLLPLLLDQ